MTMSEELKWELKMFYDAYLRAVIRTIIREVIDDLLVNPRQKQWEAFTACQSITPR